MTVLGKATPDQQIQAVKAILEKVDDVLLRRRIAQVMLVELEKDEASAAEKLLVRASRGDSGEAAMQHLRYILDLEPIACALREQLKLSPLKPGDLSRAQREAGSSPNT